MPASKARQAGTLSTNPSAVRQRLRRSGRAHDQDLAMIHKPVSEWDLEELARGKPRAKDGSFKGVKPSWISNKVAEEAKRRLKEETIGQLSSHVGMALKVVKDLMDNTELDDDGYPIVDNRLKLDAAKFIVEHTIGKPRQRVDIEAGDTLQDMLAHVLVNPDGTPAHPIIEGEVVEYEDEDASD